MTVATAPAETTYKLPLWEGTPPNHQDSDLQETIFKTGPDEKAVPIQNSLQFYEALLKNGVSAEMRLYPYGGNGYSLAIGNGHLSDWPARCVAWMKSLDSK